MALERSATFAAVDLGASSGRVITGTVGPHSVSLREVHRFANDPVQLPTGLHWDILRLFHEVLTGLRAAANAQELAGIGIDSWAIDYGLLSPTGALLGNPYSYRDARTLNRPDNTGLPGLDPAALHAINGLQQLPFTSIHQLQAEEPTRLSAAGHALLLPDLLGFWLTGLRATEITNASTTGLLDATTRRWSDEVFASLRIQPALFGDLRMPGDTIGPLLRGYQESTGIGPRTPVIAVGSHDTASAVVGVPAIGEAFAYICCGTWGLVGVELDTPVLTEASRTANFTNELGVDGRVRYLRNVAGLWLLQESIRTWESAGTAVDLNALIGAAAALPTGGPVIDVGRAEFVAPGDMPARIGAACATMGLRQPVGRAEITRCILDSLAAAFARTVHDAAELAGKRVDVVHLVGGGARNALLCQLTADACGLPVLAGPVEATALGNTLVQARSAGLIHGSLESLRALLRSTQHVTTYRPRAGLANTAVAVGPTS